MTTENWFETLDELLSTFCKVDLYDEEEYWVIIDGRYRKITFWEVLP